MTRRAGCCRRPFTVSTTPASTTGRTLSSITGVVSGARAAVAGIEPVRKLLGAEEIARVRERRRPAAVGAYRVPSDVIDVQMRIDDVRDLLRGHAGFGEPVEIGQIEHVEAAERREFARLAVAAAGCRSR
jgi:hypothetical protein